MALLLVVGCSSTPAEQPAPDAPVAADAATIDVPAPDARPLAPEEITLRQALGIPLDAEHVLIFGQNSHLDIDWQMTFDDYYDNFVGAIFTQARQILDAQPRAFYSICEMAFLQHHLAVHPEEMAPLQAAAARGALHIVGGGMTSPDTTLPETELLLRDYLYGEAFAEDTFGLRPTAAYLPDSFGHGAAAPDILAAAGYSSVAFSRIDGASTVYFQIIFPDRPLVPGSTAARLQDLGSADFIWQGAGGANILAHFMAAPGFYCEGDNIDYDEELETPGAHTGTFMGDDPTFTDSQIDLYASNLEPWTPTPYMFVPVGCDFQYPKDQLIAYLDGYNQRRYPTTHVWAVAAPFDDFATMIAFYKDALPTVTNELTPYFEGFYGSRADVKRATRDAARPFFTAEPFAAILGDAGSALAAAAAPELELLTRADHHDFVTGTAANDVVTGEQLPLLGAAQAAGQTELSGVASAISARIPLTSGTVARTLAFNASSTSQTEVIDLTLPDGIGPVHTDVPFDPTPSASGAIHVALADMPPFSWRAIDFVSGAPAAAPAAQVSLQLLDDAGNPTTAALATRVVVSNASVGAQLDAVNGVFALTSLILGGQQAIAAPSFMITDYTDTGGLWRLGNEMSGCEFTPIAPAPEVETVTVLDQSPLEVRVAFQSASATREVRLAAGENALDLAITTGAATMTTRTVSFAFQTPADSALSTSVPGGSAVRPLEYIYSPTFWPAVDWAEVAGSAILLRQSTGVRMSTSGEVELFAVRNAPLEKCDIEGGRGDDNGTHRIEWRLVAPGVDGPEGAAQAFNRPIDLEPVALTQSSTTDLPAAQSILAIDRGVISAFKPAERGGGVILRVLLTDGPATVTLPASLVGKMITRVDATEHDLAAVGPAGATLVLDPAIYGSIASVRIQ